MEVCWDRISHANVSMEGRRTVWIARCVEGWGDGGKRYVGNVLIVERRMDMVWGWNMWMC